MESSVRRAVAECYLKLSSSGIATDFCGYEGVTKADSKISAIFMDGKTIESLEEGQRAELIVERKHRFMVNPAARSVIPAIWRKRIYLCGAGYKEACRKTFRA